MIDELLPLFISRDKMRPNICTPQYDNGNVVDSDAHILIIAPEKYFKNKVEFSPTFPDYKKIMPAYSESDFVGLISVESIKPQVDMMDDFSDYHMSREECIKKMEALLDRVANPLTPAPRREAKLTRPLTPAPHLLIHSKREAAEPGGRIGTTFGAERRLEQGGGSPQEGGGGRMNWAVGSVKAKKAKFLGIFF